MRGTLESLSGGFPVGGIIPAYAGNTGLHLTFRRFRWDHPRVCGEHRIFFLLTLCQWGSSPRMRGTPVSYYSDSGRYGIIPAYAGNTRGVQESKDGIGDHPRVCGEHDTLERHGGFRPGSSPRMRGTPSRNSWRRRTPWIIPAYAGNTHGTACNGAGAGDHPRVCGEHAALNVEALAAAGSSPRMRGTLADQPQATPVDGIIPAYAGNTFRVYQGLGLWRDHPRVCGEHGLEF